MVLIGLPTNSQNNTKNVGMSDKSWEPAKLAKLDAELLLFSCLCSKVALSLSHSLTLSHSFTLSFTLSRHDEQLLFSCMFKSRCLLPKIAMLFSPLFRGTKYMSPLDPGSCLPGWMPACHNVENKIV